jgi:hypothetical protein
MNDGLTGGPRTVPQSRKRFVSLIQSAATCLPQCQCHPTEVGREWVDLSSQAKGARLGVGTFTPPPPAHSGDYGARRARATGGNIVCRVPNDMTEWHVYRYARPLFFCVALASPDPVQHSIFNDCIKLSGTSVFEVRKSPKHTLPAVRTVPQHPKAPHSSQSWLHHHGPRLDIAILTWIPNQAR